MFVNKLFFNQVTNKLITTLEDKKKNYENKILEYKDEIIENPANQILKESRGTIKATDLLNGPPLNKIFTEINNIPNNDILRIYCLYFQVINHKNAKNYLCFLMIRHWFYIKMFHCLFQQTVSVKMIVLCVHESL